MLMCEQEYVDYKKAMEILNMGQATFFRRVQRGIIPSYEDKLNPGKRVFKVSELKALQENRYTPKTNDD